jgi:hypothetical protein
MALSGFDLVGTGCGRPSAASFWEQLSRTRRPGPAQIAQDDRPPPAGHRAERISDRPLVRLSVPPGRVTVSWTVHAAVENGDGQG